MTVFILCLCCYEPPMRIEGSFYPKNDDDERESVRTTE